MLLTAESTAAGDLRIYATQIASVVSYFVDDGEGGCQLIVEAGELACRWSTTAEKINAVRDAVLVEVARRLNCLPHQVHQHSLTELHDLSDPVLAERVTWTRRRHNRRVAR